jgi:hypothetical protein
MSNELERIWKEVFVTQFKVLSQCFPGVTKEKQENLNHYSTSPHWDLKPGPPEHKAGVQNCLDVTFSVYMLYKIDNQLNSHLSCDKTNNSTFVTTFYSDSTSY